MPKVTCNRIRQRPFSMLKFWVSEEVEHGISTSFVEEVEHGMLVPSAITEYIFIIAILIMSAADPCAYQKPDQNFTIHSL